MENNTQEQSTAIDNADNKIDTAQTEPEPTKNGALAHPVALSTLLIGMGIAVVVSSLISMLGTRYLAKHGLLGVPESNVVTLDTGSLVAAHAKAMSTLANTPDDMTAMNKRFLVGFQKSLDAYKQQGVLILQKDAAVESPVDVTADFLTALIPPQAQQPATQQPPAAPAPTPGQNAPAPQ